MQLHLDSNIGVEVIVTVAADCITTRTGQFTTSFIITPECVLADWPPRQICELQTSDMEILLENNAEVYLVGTGLNQHFPSPALSRCFADAGKAVDFMTSRAACHTYNLLASEGRKVAAAVIIEAV